MQHSKIKGFKKNKFFSFQTGINFYTFCSVYWDSKPYIIYDILAYLLLFFDPKMKYPYNDMDILEEG